MISYLTVLCGLVSVFISILSALGEACSSFSFSKAAGDSEENIKSIIISSHLCRENNLCLPPLTPTLQQQLNSSFSPADKVNKEQNMMQGVPAAQARLAAPS